MLSGLRPPRSTTGPADLLRMLAARGETMPAQLVLETHGDSWFGYELKPGRHQPPTEIGQTVDPAPLPPPASKKPPENIRKPALKMPFVHLIVQREARELSGSGASAVADLTDPLQPDDTAAQARKPHWRIGFEDIVPAARLLPALRRHLGAVRSGRIDIDKLTDQLATGTLPARLPRRKIQRWHPELVVLLISASGSGLIVGTCINWPNACCRFADAPACRCASSSVGLFGGGVTGARIRIIIWHEFLPNFHGQCRPSEPRFYWSAISACYLVRNRRFAAHGVNSSGNYAWHNCDRLRWRLWGSSNCMPDYAGNCESCAGARMHLHILSV